MENYEKSIEAYDEALKINPAHNYAKVSRDYAKSAVSAAEILSADNVDLPVSSERSDSMASGSGNPDDDAYLKIVTDVYTLVDEMNTKAANSRFNDISAQIAADELVIDNRIKQVKKLQPTGVYLEYQKDLIQVLMTMKTYYKTITYTVDRINSQSDGDFELEMLKNEEETFYKQYIAFLTNIGYI